MNNYCRPLDLPILAKFTFLPIDNTTMKLDAYKQVPVLGIYIFKLGLPVQTRLFAPDDSTQLRKLCWGLNIHKFLSFHFLFNGKYVNYLGSVLRYFVFTVIVWKNYDSENNYFQS